MDNSYATGVILLSFDSVLLTTRPHKLVFALGLHPIKKNFATRNSRKRKRTKFAFRYPFSNLKKGLGCLPMKNYIHKLRTRLKIKLWHLQHKLCKFALTLSPADKLTLASIMYTIAEKGPALQEWTPGDWIAACAFFYMIREKWKFIE